MPVLSENCISTFHPPPRAVGMIGGGAGGGGGTRMSWGHQRTTLLGLWEQMERIWVISGGWGGDQAPVMKGSKTPSWHSKSKHLGYFAVHHYWHFCLLHHFIQKWKRKTIWLVGDGGGESQHLHSMKEMCHIKWINISPLKYWFTFSPSYMWNTISHHFHCLETLKRSMPKLLPVNFYLYIHEKALIVWNKKHHRRTRTQHQMVKNQKMGTIKLPKLSSKKMEN